MGRYGTFSCILGDHGEGGGPVDHAVTQTRTVSSHHSAVHSIHKELQRASCWTQSQAETPMRLAAVLKVATA